MVTDLFFFIPLSNVVLFWMQDMRGSRKFWQRGSNYDNALLFNWWGEGGTKYHYKRVNIGPPAKRHLNGVLLACRWWPNIECWLGSFVIFQGIRTSIAKKPYILRFFRRWGSGHCPPPPSGSAMQEQEDLQWLPFTIKAATSIPGDRIWYLDQ